MRDFLQAFGWHNIAALVWFIACFKGYTWFAIVKSRHTPCLANVLHIYRAEWMERLLRREMRVADAALIANLERSVAFFASSTMIILAGLLTLLGSTDKALSLFSDLPLVSVNSKLEWELKLLVLTLLFVYAFFKFTWSLRQYGFCAVLVGSAPMPAERPSEAAANAFVARTAKMISMAANNFNNGLRSYYFSLAMLGWFINAWVFMAMSALVVVILYGREFRSSTLETLTHSLARREDYKVGFLDE